MFKHPISQLKRWMKDTSGSEVIELIYTVAVLLAVLLMAMFIFSYALQTNQVSYAAKRLTREIEVTGKYNQEDVEEMLRKLLSNYDDLEPTIRFQRTGESYAELNAVEGYTTELYIQLRDKFSLDIDAKYKVSIFTMGKGESITQLSIPIHVHTDGQSEIWWRGDTTSGIEGGLLTQDT